MSSLADAVRTVPAALVCESGDPWDRFNRATLMPALINASMLAADSTAGPSVQTILVRGRELLGREIWADKALQGYYRPGCGTRVWARFLVSFKMAAMEELRTLIELQDVDIELQALDEALAGVRKKLQDEGDLPKIKAQLVKIDAVLENRSVKHRAAERKIEELVTTVKGIDKRLYDGSVTNLKEVEALGEQREFSSTRRVESEDVLLDLMVEMDDFQNARDRHVKAIARLTGARERQIVELKASEPDLLSEIAELKSVRKGHASQVPPTLLARYETLRKSKGGRAMAMLNGHLCGVCRVELPVGDLGRAKTGQEIVQCNSCRRIIVAG
jgi:predicted  nucleic acid-binding Zn-ribbon protein